MKILPPLEEEDTMLAALSYPFWFITSWLILITKKKEEPFLKFHALQSLILGGVMTIGYFIIGMILVGIYHCTPSLKNIISGKVWQGYMWQGVVFVILFSLFWLIYIIGSSIVFFFAYKAYRGGYFKIPYIGNYIENKYFSYLREENVPREEF